MVKLSHNKGFTLVEILVVCFGVFMVIFMFVIPLISSLYTYDTHTDFQYCQLEAMASQKQCQFNDTLWFNKNGNINQAQTQQFGRKICVFQLGFGRFKCAHR